MAAVAAALLLQALPGWAQPRAPSHLLVVSIDGLAWSRLAADLPRLPTLKGILGAGSGGPLETVFPSMTWAAHAAIATGALPGHNGVLGNRFYDRERDDVVETWQRDKSLLRAPTLWQVAAAAGWTTAALLWPQTSRDKTLGWQVPEVYGQTAFGEGATPGLLAQIERDLAVPVPHMARLGGEEAFLLDSWTRTVATWLIAKQQPRLLLVHFLSVDTYAHSYGPASPEPGWGLELIDRYLGDVLAAYDRAGLRGGLAVCIVSDHGFLPLTRAYAPADDLSRANLRTNERKLLRFAVNGQAIFVYGKGRALATEPPPEVRGKPKPRAVDKAIDKARQYFGSRDEFVERIIGPDAYLALGLGDPQLDPNLPDFIALLAPDVQSIMGTRPAPRGRIASGGHGYLPTHPALQGVFALSGPGVAHLAQPLAVRAIDVAPTLAKLQGWTWPVPQDGQAALQLLAH